MEYLTTNTHIAPPVVSFFQKSLWKNPVPLVVVLDTAQTVRKFKTILQEFTHIDPQESEILQLIFEAFRYKENALLELQYSMLAMIHDNFGLMWDERSQEMERICNVVSELGRNIFDQLVRLGIYEGGYLFYTFTGRTGDDLVLSRCPLDEETSLRAGAR